MKKILPLLFVLVVMDLFANAQCRRNEIGIGVGPMQLYHSNTSFSTNIKENLSKLTRVNTDASSYSKKVSSRNFPALYYGYKLNRRFTLRTSFNVYQETRTLDLNSSIAASTQAMYEGKFTQTRLTTGVSMNVSNCSCMRTYISTDIVQYLEFAKEKSATPLNESSSIPNSNTNSTTYSIGFNPSFGIKKRLCHNMSMRYEAGVEVKYNTGNFNSLNFICTPLNRLSLNYSF